MSFGANQSGPENAAQLKRDRAYPLVIFGWQHQDNSSGWRHIGRALSHQCAVLNGGGGARGTETGEGEEKAGGEDSHSETRPMNGNSTSSSSGSSGSSSSSKDGSGGGGGSGSGSGSGGGVGDTGGLCVVYRSIGSSQPWFDADYAAMTNMSRSSSWWLRAPSGYPIHVPFAPDPRWPSRNQSWLWNYALPEVQDYIIEAVVKPIVEADTAAAAGVDGVFFDMVDFAICGSPIFRPCPAAAAAAAAATTTKGKGSRAYSSNNNSSSGGSSSTKSTEQQQEQEQHYKKQNKKQQQQQQQQQQPQQQQPQQRKRKPEQQKLCGLPFPGGHRAMQAYHTGVWTTMRRAASILAAHGQRAIISSQNFVNGVDWHGGTGNANGSSSRGGSAEHLTPGACVLPEDDVLRIMKGVPWLRYYERFLDGTASAASAAAAAAGEGGEQNGGGGIAGGVGEVVVRKKSYYDSVAGPHVQEAFQLTYNRSMCVWQTENALAEARAGVGIVAHTGVLPGWLNASQVTPAAMQAGLQTALSAFLVVAGAVNNSSSGTYNDSNKGAARQQQQPPPPAFYGFSTNRLWYDEDYHRIPAYDRAIGQPLGPARRLGCCDGDLLHNVFIHDAAGHTDLFNTPLNTPEACAALCCERDDCAGFQWSRRQQQQQQQQQKQKQSQPLSLSSDPRLAEEEQENSNRDMANSNCTVGTPCCWIKPTVGRMWHWTFNATPGSREYDVVSGVKRGTTWRRDFEQASVELRCAEPTGTIRYLAD